MTAKKSTKATKPSAKVTAKAAKAPAKASDGASIDELHLTAFVNGPTQNPVALATILRALADDPLLAPTHGSLDDRKRSPFDLEALAMAGGTSGDDPLVWRTRRPKYFGNIAATKLPFARVLLHFEAIDADDVDQLGEALVRLVDRLQPAYAAMHFKWPDRTKEQSESLTGMSAKGLQVSKAGPPGVFAWTWFGPTLAEALGLGTLLQLGATPTHGGGVSLPLVAKPWHAPFAELRARQLEVDAALRKRGLFGDYTKLPVEPGPAWTPKLSAV